MLRPSKGTTGAPRPLVPGATKMSQPEPAARVPTRVEPRFPVARLVLTLAALSSVLLLSLVVGGDGSAQAVDLAAIHLQETIARARELATTERRVTGVRFDVTGDRLALVDGTGASIEDPITGRPFLIDLNGLGGRSGIDIVSAWFGRDGKTLRFDARGRPMSGGAVVLCLGGEVRGLQVDVASGRLE